MKKKVFLTGASAGIGLAIAKRLTSLDYEVWGSSRSRERLPVLENFHPVVLDLSSTESITKAYATALEQAGHFDVLINNAGAGVFGPIQEFSAQQLREQFEVLVVGPHELIRSALPAMRASQRGTILNITSLAGRFPVPYLTPYSSAKAALSHYLRGLRLELSHTGIVIVDLQPGDICSDFHQATLRLPESSDTAVRVQSAWKVITQHMAVAPAPERVADKVVALLENPNPAQRSTVGSFDQAFLSPLLSRIFPQCWIDWGIKHYYRLGQK